MLGIETTKTVSDEGLDVDTDYYKSDYGTDIYDGDKLQQLEDDAAAQAVAEQEEGSVLLKMTTMHFHWRLEALHFF